MPNDPHLMSNELREAQEKLQFMSDRKWRLDKIADELDLLHAVAQAAQDGPCNPRCACELCTAIDNWEKMRTTPTPGATP